MAEAWVDIGITAMGLTEVARSFQMAEELTEDLSDPLGEVMDLLLDSVAAQFDTEGEAAAGMRWAPLSDDYAKWKAVHFPGWPILVATGEMKRAMLDREEAVHVGPDLAVYEPISDIAGYHQSGEDWFGPAWGHRIGGGTGPPYIMYPHHLPQREMVDLTEELKHEAVDRTFARWISTDAQGIPPRAGDRMRRRGDHARGSFGAR